MLREGARPESGRTCVAEGHVVCLVCWYAQAGTLGELPGMLTLRLERDERVAWYASTLRRSGMRELPGMLVRSGCMGWESCLVCWYAQAEKDGKVAWYAGTLRLSGKSRLVCWYAQVCGRRELPGMLVRSGCVGWERCLVCWYAVTLQGLLRFFSEHAAV